MNRTRDDVLGCPYCGRPLHWSAGRWFGRGCFECDQCGEFPDLRHTTASTENTNQSKKTRPRIPRKGDRPRVLLVDDSAEQNDLYALMLEPTASVITASSGEDAPGDRQRRPARRDRSRHSDAGYGRMGGVPPPQDQSDHAAVPVIMLTALEEVELMARARRVGAAAVLTKPCPAEAAGARDRSGRSAAASSSGPCGAVSEGAHRRR